jgi:hypothetical protein
VLALTEEFGVKKLPLACQRFVLPLFTTFPMTFLVSGLATYRAIGFAPDLLPTWMESWMFSWVVACPTMFFVMPFVRRAVNRVVEDR